MLGHIGFTGTQRGMNKRQLAEVRLVLDDLRRQGATHFHHGDCVDADAQAHAIAKELGYTTVSHPPDNPNKRAFTDADIVLPKLSYLDRNHAIVDAVIHLLATPREMTEQLRSGTWATVRYARKMRKEVRLITPYLPRGLQEGTT